MAEYSGGRAVALRRYSDKRRALINEAKNVPCADCGGTFPPCAMDFDHRDPSTKEFGIGPAVQSIPRILAEIEKCDVVCANCHRIRTHLCPA